MSSQSRDYPEDALAIMSMLDDLGIEEYSPGVIDQLLEFSYLYVTSILDDARAVAGLSKRQNIDDEDVKVAINMQLDKTFRTPPPRDVILELARVTNNCPLPWIKPHCGLRLPPERYRFANSNYRHKTIYKKLVTNVKKPFTTPSSGTPSCSGIQTPKNTVRSNTSVNQPQQTTEMSFPSTSGTNGADSVIKINNKFQQISTSMSDVQNITSSDENLLQLNETSDTPENKQSEITPDVEDHLMEFEDLTNFKRKRENSESEVSPSLL